MLTRIPVDDTYRAVNQGGRYTHSEGETGKMDRRTDRERERQRARDAETDREDRAYALMVLLHWSSHEELIRKESLRRLKMDTRKL